MSVQKINLFEQVSQFYIGSQASIEATADVQEGSLGYATDINKMGSYNGATWDWAGSGSGGHTIQDEGTPLTARTNLNFVGAGVTATDDAGNNATVVTIPGGGGSAHIIEDEGTPLTARANLNFIGGGVTATDNAGANSTDVTIPAAPTQEEIEDMVGGMVSGNTETGIDVTYDDASGKLNFDAQTAGDLRYAPIAKGVTNGDSHDHLGGDGGTIDYSSLTGSISDLVTLGHFQDINRFGIIGSYDGSTGTTISFDPATYTFTLTDSGSGWGYYLDGVAYKFTGNRTIVLTGTPPSAGDHYIYFDDGTGVLKQDTNPWSLEGNKIPVAMILFDDTLTPKYWLGDERHTSSMDRRVHLYLHTNIGSRWTSGGVPSGYSVAPASPTNANNTFGLSSAVMFDEDIKHTLSALVDPDGTTNSYVIMFKSGGSWVWEYSTMPYRFTPAGFIQYDNAGTMTQGQTVKYYNTYLIVTNFKEVSAGVGSFHIIHGKQEFSSLSAAQAEDPYAFDFTGFPLVECVIAWQFTWQTNNSYSSKGECRLAAAPKKLGTPITSSIAAPPEVGAGGVSTDVTNFDVLLSAADTTVQKALETLDGAGDARYAPIAKGVTNGDSHDHLGGDGGAIAYSSLTGTPTILAFNDAEGNPSDDVRIGPADGTSTYAARRDHSHRDNLPPKFINRGTPTWGSSPVNDYDTAGVDEIIAVVGPGTIELTGMVNGVQGNYVYLYSHNISTGNLLLKHLDGRSTVQFRLPGQQDMLISKSEGVLLQQQAATIWVVLGTTSGSLLQGVPVDPGLIAAATTNDVLTYDGSKLTLSAPSSGGHTIQEEGTPLTTRANLNFKGTGITATDNSGANATDVTVVINETTFTTTDITTGDVSTSKHGLVPKLPNTMYKALRGDGSWGGIADRDGWIQFLDASFAYASASTFTITGDYTATFRKGLRLLWHDSVGWKWGNVLSSTYGAPNTTVTIFTNTDYVLASSMDYLFWSDVALPNGFPSYFNYAPATTNITNCTVTGKYFVLGSQVFGDWTVTRGASSTFGAQIYVGFPCSANQNSYFVVGNVSLVDSGVALYTGIQIVDTSVRCMSASGAYAVYAYVSSTVPFTWGSTDYIEGSFRYRY